jgi:hypothetical protein
MTNQGIQVLDIYTPNMAQCSPVPFTDDGPNKCKLCASHRKALTVHYTGAGYHFIAGHVVAALNSTLV